MIDNNYNNMKYNFNNTTQYIKYLKSLNFLIVGFTEKTGLSAAFFFEKYNIKYSISDNKSEKQIRSILNKKIKKFNFPVKIFSGKQELNQLDNIQAILLSSGVPRSLDIIKRANRIKIPVFNDVDLIYPFIKKKKIIGVTGTDGKTTTVSLLYHVLSNKYKTLLAGNVGNPILFNIDKINEYEVIILELSSYMLEDLKMLRLNISIITNIAEDHLDRYKNINQYAKTKYNILKYGTNNDYFIKNLDDKYLNKLEKYQLKTIKISIKKNADAYYLNDLFHYKNLKFKFSDCKINGVHNIYNILFVIVTAKILRIQNTIIKNSIISFPGLPHRLEFVREYNSVKYFNDSKATTIQAMTKAIESFNKNIILMVGGQDKGLNFKLLLKKIEKIKYIVFFGQDGNKIKSQIKKKSKDTSINKKISSFKYKKKFDVAVKFCVEIAKPNDVVLLSPGCTSWDEFLNYEERGNKFKSIVNDL